MSQSNVLHASRVESECLFRENKYGSREWLPAQRAPWLRGTGVHGGREYALRAYLAEKSLPPVEEVRTATWEAIETRVEQDNERGMPSDPGDVKDAMDEADLIVRADYALALPEIAPHVLAIEEELTVPIGDTGWTLSGRLDARGRDPVTGTGAIIDLKTGAPRSAQEAADLSNQLSNYALLHQVHFGTIPTFALDYVWTMAKGPKADTIARDGLKVCEIDAGVNDSGKPVKVCGVRRRVTTYRSADDLAAALKLLRFRIDAEAAGWHPPGFGGFMGPCGRCAHWGHADPAMRCPFRPANRTAGLSTTNEEE